MKKMALGTLVALLLVMPYTQAQFTGPSTAVSTEMTVAQAQTARTNTYITVTGNIVAHERSDYFTFRDHTGEIRVEIEPSVWQGQEVSPDTKVRLFGEVDRGMRGRYISVKTLTKIAP